MPGNLRFRMFRAPSGFSRNGVTLRWSWSYQWHLDIVHKSFSFHFGSGVGGVWSSPLYDQAALLCTGDKVRGAYECPVPSSESSQHFYIKGTWRLSWLWMGTVPNSQDVAASHLPCQYIVWDQVESRNPTHALPTDLCSNPKSTLWAGVALDMSLSLCLFSHLYEGNQDANLPGTPV